MNYSMQLVKVLVSLFLCSFYLVEDVCSQRIRFPEEEYNSNDVDQGVRGVLDARKSADGTGRASRTGRPNPTRARPTSPPRRTVSIPRRPNSAPERPVAVTQPPVSVPERPRVPVPRGPGGLMESAEGL
ncbi:hypothetical protein CEXT_212241 [Caerostris extrusa]|uniref:Uncharacterized protein n=1 Tax=Caerostris extrusa TaxID=172846 RepID=A0AAV4TLN5_CAEEX|nr:hypothetical protein CEXT_212241 [Caerostris extrusa]